MLLLIVGLILFVGLVVVHEWGHFVMARRNGVEVEEFGRITTGNFERFFNLPSTTTE